MTTTQTRHTLDLTDAMTVDAGTDRHDGSTAVYVTIGDVKLWLHPSIASELRESLEGIEECTEDYEPTGHEPFCDCPECVGC